MNTHGHSTPHWLPVLLAALLTMLLTACSAPPHPPLRVGVSPWVGYDPLVLAQEKGLIDPEKVRVIELFSSTESSRALRNGSLDAAALSLDEALRLADEGVALKIVGVIQVSRNAAAVLSTTGSMHPSQLKGKRIALERTALGTVVLDRLLKSAGLQLSDVSQIQVEAPLHEAVLLSTLADAVITFEPMKSRLLAQGYGVVFDSREMLGDIDDVLVVTLDDWENHRELVKELLVGWERGRKAMAADLPAAAKLLAAGADLTPDEYAKAFSALSFQTITDSANWLTGTPPPLIQHAAPLAASLQRLNLIRHPPDWAMLIDGIPVAEVNASMQVKP